MPYKNNETGRNKAKERMQRMRSREGVTSGVTKERENTVKDRENTEKAEGVTLFHYVDGKRENLDKLPEGYKVLSDGQVWKPLTISKVVTEHKAEGTSTITAAKLLIICQSLNKFDVAQEVRYGAYGPTMDIVSDRLGAN